MKQSHRRCLLLLLGVSLLFTLPATVTAQDETTARSNQTSTITEAETGITTTAPATTFNETDAGTTSVQPAESSPSVDPTTEISTPDRDSNSNQTQEANDDYQTAPVIDPETQINSEIRGEDDIDWYEIDLTDEGRISVEFQSGNNSNLSVFLYDTGELVDSSYAPPDQTAVIEEPSVSGGPYYVAVKSVESNQGGNSDYRFEVLTNSDTTTGQNQDTSGSSGENGGSGLSFTLVAGIIVILAVGTLIWRQT